MSKKNFIIATRENFAFQCYRTFISLKKKTRLLHTFTFTRQRVSLICIADKYFCRALLSLWMVCITKLSIVYLYFGGAEIAV